MTRTLQQDTENAQALLRNRDKVRTAMVQALRTADPKTPAQAGLTVSQCITLRNAGLLVPRGDYKVVLTPMGGCVAAAIDAERRTVALAMEQRAVAGV